MNSNSYEKRKSTSRLTSTSTAGSVTSSIAIVTLQHRRRQDISNPHSGHSQLAGRPMASLPPVQACLPIARPQHGNPPHKPATPAASSVAQCGGGSPPALAAADASDAAAAAHL